MESKTQTTFVEESATSDAASHAAGSAADGHGGDASRSMRGTPYWPLWLAAGGLIAATMGIAGVVGGGRLGVVYLLAYVLATAPGWPIGWWLFGRRHAAGWVTGALLGYAVSAWTIWFATAMQADLVGRLSAWAIVLIAIWSIWIVTARHRAPLVSLPAWTRRDTVALLLLLWLVPLLVGPPFRNVGATDAAGNRSYRAYFTADVLWHGALTAELTRFSLPPKNPYAADKTLHYYWTYFLVPTTIVTIAPRLFGEDYIPWLLINATGAGLLFVAMIAVTAWCCVPRRLAAMTAVAIVLLAASAEGTYVLLDALRNGEPVSSMRQHNIDAATRFLFDGLAIDNLPRSLWYTPQHAAACAYGLIALLLAATQALRGPLRAGAGPVLAAGLALAASVTFSPLLGGMFALIYGLGLVSRVIVSAEWRLLPIVVARQALAIVPVLLAIAALFRWSMIEGAGNALHIGYHGFARNAPIATLCLSLGPALLPVAIGLGLRRFWRAPDPDTRAPRTPAASLLVSATGLLVGLALFYFASLPSIDPVWIGWRAGQIMLVCLPPLIAHALVAIGGGARYGRALAVAAAAIAFAAGLPTTAIDAYNAQDIRNHGMAAGFRWTITVTPAEQEAAAWIRRSTHPAAVVQMEPTVRGRETWTFIPTFAQRRMHAGLPISLLAEDEYEIRSRRMRTAYGVPDARYAWQMLRYADVDYVYIDRAEREAFPPDSLAKFDTSPDLFRRVFRNAEVTIYAVQR